MPTPEPHREAALLEAFVRLTDTLVDDFDLLDLLHGLTVDCVRLFPSAAAGLLITDDRGTLQLVASSSEAARLVELFQLQADEGPCLDCFRSALPVTVPDLHESGRWPRFTAWALERGFRSVHAVPMRLRGQTIGALNLFGAGSGVLPPDDLRVAQALADAATITVLQERGLQAQHAVSERLQAALRRRAVVEQAKGVLAEVGGLEVGDAFVRLRDHAHETDQSLTDLALDIVTRRVGTDFLHQSGSVLGDGETGP
jgi:GAF domain-containing protein